jgi:hypothetical protein
MKLPCYERNDQVGKGKRKKEMNGSKIIASMKEADRVMQGAPGR